MRILPLAAALILAWPATAAVPAPDSEETARQLDRFMGVFERVRARYVRPVSDETLIEGAIEGMLASLDPHSSYLSAADLGEMMEQTEGEYGGLGVTVTIEQRAVRVVSVVDESGASRAGLRPGDIITHADGRLLVGLTLADATEQLKGEPGTSVRLTLLRAGVEQPIQVDVTRSVVQTPSVRFSRHDDVGYIRIATFLNDDTARLTADAVTALQREIGPGLAGYVIDLRSNGGGLLDQAIAVADLFLERGEVASQRGRAPQDIERFYARPGDLAEGKPLIVLIDAGSASASEIVAGALQDHGRAILMGERSFGKGLVQSLVPLGPDSALRLSTDLYFTPSGRSVQERGIEPNIRVPQLSDAHRGSRIDVREADIRRHLIALGQPEDEDLQADDAEDPRFARTPEELAEDDIEDFQLHYATETLQRLSRPAQASRAGDRGRGG